MLTHSSGIDDLWIRRPEAVETLEKGELFHSYQELIQLALGEALRFEPGTGIQYSNTSYELLTAVIERVSNRSYTEFVQARIFGALAMSSTGTGSVPGNTIRGYIRSRDGVWRFGNSFAFITATLGLGGIY